MKYVEDINGLYFGLLHLSALYALITAVMMIHRGGPLASSLAF